ncbi:MAG: ethanolamine ammonia-lyase subunit EutC [Pseudomonadota bacterium]
MRPPSSLSLRRITEARITLGHRGRAQTTDETLTFAYDHARARNAVLSALDEPRIVRALDAHGLTHCVVTSEAGTRDTYIRRPDLGRRLAPDAPLPEREPCDVALVLGDGLSAVAAGLNGPAYLAALVMRLERLGLTHSPIVLARQARVALGDQIALRLGAPTVVMALGERPGLSAADSLGVYVTHTPTTETQDSGRNCISNIREAGLPVVEAANQTMRLIKGMRASGISGVALAQAIASGKLPR